MSRLFIMHILLRSLEHVGEKSSVAASGDAERGDHTAPPHRCDV